MNAKEIPDGIGVAAISRAIARFDDNRHVSADAGFWRSCAWAMADDLRNVDCLRLMQMQNEIDRLTNEVERLNAERFGGD